MSKQKTIINPQEYLQIPNSNYVIAKLEPDWTKEFDYENSHKQVLQKGLEIPTPSLFISHLLNVIRAYQGKNKLYDGNSQEVSKQELEDIYKHLTTKHINGGAWSWLNSRFVQGAGFNNLDLEKVTGIDSNGNLLTQKNPLEECLMENCYADINFNSQGLATKKFKTQSYKHGENLYFWYPREGCVARFRAYSDRSDLLCVRYPSSLNASLGVFASFLASENK